MGEASDFYGNKVRREFKGKDQAKVDFVDTYKKLLGVLLGCVVELARDHHGHRGSCSGVPVPKPRIAPNLGQSTAPNPAARARSHLFRA